MRSLPRSCAGTGVAASSDSSGLFEIARRRPRRARHLRQLPHDRVPAATVPRLRLLSTSTSRTAGFEAYLARLHNLAGNRPLLMAEIGLDSRRNGEMARRKPRLADPDRTRVRLRGRVRLCLDRRMVPGGYEIDDWDFGLTDRDDDRSRPDPWRKRLPRFHSPIGPGPASRWSSAATTGQGPCATAWRA